MALSRKYRTASGELKEETCYVSVVAWERQAETAGEYLKKGSAIMVEGSLRYEQWEKDGVVPRAAWTKAGEAGLLCADMPEEYGGAGLDYMTYIVVVEEIAKHCLATAVGLGVQGLPQIMINLFGTDEQKGKYLEPLAAGEKLGAFALTEPGAGSDAASLKTTARLDGDGYVLKLIGPSEEQRPETGPADKDGAPKASP